VIRHDFFVCECGTTEHHIVVSQFTWKSPFTADEGDIEEIVFGVHLEYRGFLQRLWIGLRYIFGDKLTHPYGETILTKEKAEELANLILERVGASNESTP
jgi:hypothetical protein